MIKLIDILEDDCTPCRSKRLHEAYSEKAIQGFLDRFKEQADDLNINITDSQLRAYIKTFDRIKEKLPGERRDLTKWKVGEFIRFVTTGKGAEKDETEEIDITPDVVYHNDNDTIVVYNGSTEGNCVKYGKGEEWCITRSSFPSYRYSSGKGYPTFYLAKNSNLPSADKLSFVAIQVRDPEKTSEYERYVYTNRKNKPYESSPMSLDRLTSEVPWLKNIPNLKSVLKYIPLSSTEKLSHQYRNSPISYKEWAKLPYKVKEQYLVVRRDARGRYSDGNIFTDISDNEFVSTYLSKYPDILKFVAETPGIIQTTTLIKNLSSFPDSARKSIIANLQVPINDELLGSSAMPFEVKKLLTKLKKWELESDEKLYVTQDGNTIVKLTLGDDLKMGLYQAEDDYPSVKLNKRTSKFLLDYPELNKIPLALLVNLSEKGAIDSDVPKKVIDDAKKNPNSTLAVKETEDGDIVVDSSTLSAYKIKGNKISPVPSTDEQVQDVLKGAQKSDAFKKNTLNLFTGPFKNLPKTVDRAALASIINSLPYEERIVPIRPSYGDPVNSVAFVHPRNNNIYFMTATPREGLDFVRTTRYYDKDEANQTELLEKPQFEKYFDYLRSKGTLIDDNTIESVLSNAGGNRRLTQDFLNSNPPLDPNNVFIPVTDRDGVVYLLNTVNRRDSRKVSPNTGNLVNAILSQGRYDELLRIARPQQAAVQEPVAPQQAQAQQGQQPARTYYQQAAPTGDVNITNTMTALGAGNQFARIPDRDRRRLNITNGAPLNVRTDGGARRRNQLLGNAGQVTQAYAALTSRIYVIRLANGTNVISIKVYPGNREYLLIPGTRAYEVHEPEQLLTLLRQNNLAEVRRYLVNSYIDTNPTNLEEFKNLLRQHLNK